MEGSGVRPVAEAEEVPSGVGAGVGVLVGVGVFGVLVRVVAAGPVGPVPEADVPSRRPTSCFNIVAATSRQTDLTMKASNAHTRSSQTASRSLCCVVSGCARMDLLYVAIV